MQCNSSLLLVSLFSLFTISIVVSANKDDCRQIHIEKLIAHSDLHIEDRTKIRRLEETELNAGRKESTPLSDPTNAYSFGLIEAQVKLIMDILSDVIKNQARLQFEDYNRHISATSEHLRILGQIYHQIPTNYTDKEIINIVLQISYGNITKMEELRDYFIVHGTHVAITSMTIQLSTGSKMQS